MKNILILFLTFFSIQAYSQIYKANKGWENYFVEIKNDSIHIEKYYYSYPDFVIKSFDEVIPLNDTKFNNTVVLKLMNNNYILKFRENIEKRFKKLHLKPYEAIGRTSIRNRYYSSHKRDEMIILQDSLSDPEILINMDINNIYRKVDVNLNEKEYSKRVDKITDSLTYEINKLKNSKIDLFYQKLDSITKLDSTEIYNLLSSSNYKFKYSKSLLQKIAFERPEILISYIDTEPENEKLVLRSIKNHHNFKEITKSVKNTKLSTKGKKKIVKQKTKRILTDIGLGTAYITIILGELAGLIAIGIWIF